MVEIRLRGEDLLAFTRDLEERAERLEVNSEFMLRPGRMLTTKHRELIRAELQIGRTLLDIGQSRLTTEDANGASRALRNAESAIEGIRDLLATLEASDGGRHLRTEFLDLQKRIEDLREKIGVARRTLSKHSTKDS